MSGSVLQSGYVSPGNLAVWGGNGIIMDGGPPGPGTGGPFLPLAGGIVTGPTTFEGGLTFQSSFVSNNYDLTGFLKLSGTTFGINVSTGAPPKQINYVSAGWHNFVIGTGDYVTIDNRTFSVGPPSARAEPEWASGTWGGAGRFVAVDSNGLLTLSIKESPTPTFPTGITAWGIQRSTAAGYQVWGVFGRADLYANGGALNEFNTYNFAATPSGRLPPIYTFNSGEFNTFCIAAFGKGDFPSSIGVLVGNSIQPFLTGIYVDQSAATQWGMVLDANATDDFPANGSLMVKNKGSVGVPVQIQITGGLNGPNPVLKYLDNVSTDRFVLDQNGDITVVRNIVMSGSITVGSPVIMSGAGVPTITLNKGSLYLRTDGGVGSTQYVSQGGGTWNPVAGV